MNSGDTPLAITAKNSLFYISNSNIFIGSRNVMEKTRQIELRTGAVYRTESNSKINRSWNDAVNFK